MRHAMTRLPAPLPLNLNSPALKRLRAIFYMIAAVAIFAVMDALMKGLTSRYGTLQVSCLRSLSSLVCMSVVILYRRSFAELKPHRAPWHLLRGVLGICMLASFVFAIHRLSLAQTYSIYLTAPLLMTALSVPVFGERVSGGRWFAIVLGLGGVIIILKPWARGDYSLVAAGAAVLSTVCYAINALTVRSLSSSNSSLSLVFWYLVLVGVGSGVLGAHEWRAIGNTDWWWLLAIGITGALGQFWLTVAFSRAPPSVVGPFEYTSILWAFLIDRIFWGATPSLNLLIGALIVVGSGIFVIEQERRLAVSATPPP
jgi:drug/metabolite transporter (DMT)-like permease